MAKMRCRFCRRKLPPTKYVRHSCNHKKEAKGYYENWKQEHRDDVTTVNKYPTFEAWDLATLDGNLVYPAYPFSPPSLSSSSDGEQDVDSVSDSSGADWDDQGIVLEQGTEWTRQDDKPQYFDSNRGTLIKPSERKYEDEEEEETEEKPKVSLKDTASGIISTVSEISQQIKISTKEKGWLPIVAGVHELIMWAFEAKNRKAYFKLTKEQKKILSASYQATFGDSPLMKLKTTGQGEYDVHIVVANIEVYGEFMMGNVEGAIDRTQGLWTKWQKRSEKKKRQKQIQEEVTAHVEAEEQGPKEWPK
jgi:hypothetical protein